MFRLVMGLLLALFLFLPIETKALIESLVTNETVVIAGQASGCIGGSRNWECVETNDGDTQYLGLRDNSKRAVWGLSTSSIPVDADISLVRLQVVNKIGVCAFCITFADYHFGLASTTASSTFLATGIGTVSYKTTIHDYTLNPFTSSVWLVSDLQDLRVTGSKHNECIDFFAMQVNCFVRNTFIRIQITYTIPSPPSVSTSTPIGLIEDSYLNFYFSLLVFNLLLISAITYALFRYV